MTNENNSTSVDSCLKEDDVEKHRRRITLLNDPNYGIILCFLDKFRSILDLPTYPSQLLEDHLINYKQHNPSRLIDFHFTLLKRLSLAKNAQRDKFDSIITKFAARYDSNDNESLTTTGYLQADVTTKTRILKNLLESQFDFNHTLVERSSHELQSSPLGRDRVGASYWFFMDNHCFVRLFREDIDNERTWTNVVKDRADLEKMIRLLITDSVVRKRFPDWLVGYESFSSLPSTNEFEQLYSTIHDNMKEDEILNASSTNDDKVDVEPTTRRKSGRRQKKSIDKKMDSEDEKLNVSIKRKRGRPKSAAKSSKTKKNIKTRVNKRKLTAKAVREHTDQSEEEELSMDDMSLELRRSLQLQKLSEMQSVSATSSQLIDSSKKYSMNTRMKDSTDLRSRRRRKKTIRRNPDDRFCLSTSSSDEHIDDLSEDEDLSPTDTNDHFFELDEEEDDNNTFNEQLRTAKTAQTSTVITACYVCSKSDRPEVLLLCDDCNDAYHLECLQPMLLSVPDGDWFCPLCQHKRLSNCLIDKLKELIINFNIMQTKQFIRSAKKTFQRKMKVKEYSSDESITASESEHENNLINDDESMLSTSQINENSNLSSYYSDDEKNNISQRGRHRRARFDMKKMFYDDNDETEPTNFDLQLPKKITRLLHRHDRSTTKTDSHTKTLTARLSDSSLDLNEKLGSPIVYVNGDGNCRQMKSVITNSEQTLKIVRRWNDLQRRSRLKATNMKILNEPITSDYADENSGLGPDDLSPPCSNDSHNYSAIKDETNAINRARITLVQPTSSGSNDKCSSRNISRKADANFDQLTRDIQIAVDDAHLLSITTVVTTNQQQIKRTSKTKFSPYMTKIPSLSKLPDDAYNIFKSKDASMSTLNSNTNDLSNIILTPASSSSLLDATDDQIISITDD